MVSVKCTLEDCAYKSKRGFCTRKKIMLQTTKTEANELYCLGWATPETRLFIEVANTTSPKTEGQSHES